MNPFELVGWLLAGFLALGLLIATLVVIFILWHAFAGARRRPRRPDVITRITLSEPRR